MHIFAFLDFVWQDLLLHSFGQLEDGFVFACDVLAASLFHCEFRGGPHDGCADGPEPQQQDHDVELHEGKAPLVRLGRVNYLYRAGGADYAPFGPGIGRLSR